MHAQYEEARYAAVLAACCLEADLRALPAADQTWVGDRGTTLSGGQCARLALARAIYQVCLPLHVQCMCLLWPRPAFFSARHPFLWVLWACFLSLPCALQALHKMYGLQLHAKSAQYLLLKVVKV